jgi:hypothetical protein
MTEELKRTKELERLLKFALDNLSFLRSEMALGGDEMCDFDFCTVCGEPEYKHKNNCEALKWKADTKKILKKVA